MAASSNCWRSPASARRKSATSAEAKSTMPRSVAEGAHQKQAPHVVPLSPAALAIIEAQERRDGPRLDIRPRGGGFPGWSKSKERLDERIKEANGGKAIPHWTLHDLRASFATYAGGGLPAHELGKLSRREQGNGARARNPAARIEAILNHVSGHKAGVARSTSAAPTSARTRGARPVGRSPDCDRRRPRQQRHATAARRRARVKPHAGLASYATSVRSLRRKIIDWIVFGLSGETLYGDARDVPPTDCDIVCVENGTVAAS